MAVTNTTYNRLFTDARLTQLGDSEGTTWGISTMIVAYNQAKNMLLAMRPDAFTKIEEIVLTTGSRQYLPEDGLRLFNVVRNINQNGTIGRAIRLVSMAALDSCNPDWHVTTGTVIHEFMFDPRSPKHFYVYPSPANVGDVGMKVEIEYSAMPPDIIESNLDEFLPFDSIYDQPLIELMLYKLLSGDNEAGRNNSVHMQAAMGLLNIQSESANANDGAKRER
ncbi:DUF6682 family protein [Acinetobacter modestus]|uniref:phage adaptor protein n=1 Tax=Acinetobacter modestus TaxID=1776740 RepID=UPI003015E35B